MTPLRPTPAKPLRVLDHLRELLHRRGLTLLTTAGPNGIPSVWLEGPRCAITDTLVTLLLAYEADLINDALADPLVIYARTILVDIRSPCGCFG
jgi:hypothetical protein